MSNFSEEKKHVYILIEKLVWVWTGKFTLWFRWLIRFSLWSRLSKRQRNNNKEISVELQKSDEETAFWKSPVHVPWGRTSVSHFHGLLGQTFDMIGATKLPGYLIYLVILWTIRSSFHLTEWSSPASYLAALAGADSIVVAWRLVLTHETGLVGAGGWRWGGGSGEKVFWAGAGALTAHCCKYTTSHHQPVFTWYWWMDQQGAHTEGHFMVITGSLSSFFNRAMWLTTIFILYSPTFFALHEIGSGNELILPIDPVILSMQTPSKSVLPLSLRSVKQKHRFILT